MAIFYIIVLILAGLGILLYGMSLFSRALESTMGHSLNNKFMRVSTHPYRSYFLSAVLTFLTQKSTLVSGMIMNYVNIGTISLRQSIPFVLGLSFGNALSVLLLIFQGLNLTAILTICCFIGAVLNLFARTEKNQNIAKALVGFGMLFLGIELVGIYSKELFGVESIFGFLEHINYPIVIILLSFLFSLATTSNFASITILASLVMSGPVQIEVAVLGLLSVALGTALASYLYTVPGQGVDARRVATQHIFAHLFGFVVLGALYFTGVYQWLFASLGGNVFLTLIIVHIVQMVLPIVLVPFRGLIEKFLRMIVRDKKNDRDPSKEFILPDTVLDTFSTGYLALLQSTQKLMQKNSDIETTILRRLSEGKDMRGIMGEVQGLNKAIKICNNAVLRMSARINEKELQKSNILVNIFSDLTYLADRTKKLAQLGGEVSKKPKSLSKEDVSKLLALVGYLDSLNKLDIALIDDIIAGKTIDSEGLKCVLEYNKFIYEIIQEQRKEVYLEYRSNGRYPEGNAYFNALVNFENVNTSLENIAIKLGILSG